MKCLKNITTGNIIRVDEKQAQQMVGNTWKYVSKEEWRIVSQPKENITIGHDMGGPYEIKTENKKTKKIKK